jgi:glycosyltransferase involved in cell wall biosynthesis
METKNPVVKLPFSVIIPTRNEEERLPKLLKSIAKQSYQPEEVIVSDAFSTDKTREIAEKFGAVVTDGGPISIGRNNGTKIAKTDLFVFIDADSEIPGDDFFNKLYLDFKKRKLDIASILFRIDDESKKFLSARVFMGSYLLIKTISSLLPHPLVEGPGFLLSTRKAFNNIGGFLVLKDGIPEDLDFMEKGINLGFKYKVLNHRFIASGRRFHTPFKAVKALVGISMGAFLLKSKLHTNPKLVELSTGLYGEMGGEAERRERIKKVITIGAISGAAIVGVGLLVRMLRERKKK